MASEKKEPNKDESVDDKKSKDKTGDSIKLVIYDFDQTITSIHLYHELNYGNDDQETQLAKMSDSKLLQVFGGKQRLERLSQHFSYLKTKNVEIGIISFGYVNVIRKALQRMNLFDLYFKQSVIFGCDSIELNDADGSKAECIENTFKKSKTRETNLSENEIIFVDDDQYNIKEAKDSKTCKTVTVNPRKGMSDGHMKQIESIINQ
eukprot:355469_1